MAKCQTQIVCFLASLLSKDTADRILDAELGFRRSRLLRLVEIFQMLLNRLPALDAFSS